uniref:Integrase zinc-binding domain-containing protein n=1 Tax=Physcomitrium patens TaxID=3218 RepID=A0A2K1JJA1_PHYPA|nr:hypothetical protein PHYPA_019027 [Physcomitrium patens]
MLYHVSHPVGHFSVKRTVNRLQETYHWIGMIKDVTSFIKSCEAYQLKKPQP